LADAAAWLRLCASERNGRRLSIAGLVLVRQMPGSAKGVMFVTLEDESANANLIVWPSIFEGKPPRDFGRDDAGVPRTGAKRQWRYSSDRRKRA
jgi:DNA polymerase III alpha subunit